MDDEITMRVTEQAEIIKAAVDAHFNRMKAATSYNFGMMAHSATIAFHEIQSANEEIRRLVAQTTPDPQQEGGA